MVTACLKGDVRNAHPRRQQSPPGLRLGESTLAGPYEYAAGLYNHAASQLNPPVLHAWMVWRLIVDRGLEHAEAAGITDAVLADAQAIASAPASRRCSQRAARRVRTICGSSLAALTVLAHPGGRRAGRQTGDIQGAA
jgi:hypothetical protein